MFTSAQKYNAQPMRKLKSSTAVCKMELLPELLKIILDLVCDTRGYACTATLAWTQCAARPDHTVWQRIRSLNDYFVYGTESITTWALANVPELTALDSIGLGCALANALRADNPGAVRVLVGRISKDKLLNVAKFCGPKTCEFFTAQMVFSWKYCTCPVEFGVMFKDLSSENVEYMFANPKLSDEYLLRMTSREDTTHLAYFAAKYDRKDFVMNFCNTTRREAIDGATRGGNLNLVRAIEKHYNIKVEPSSLPIDAVVCNGRVDEFEPGSREHTEASEMLSAALGHGDIHILKNAGPNLAPIIAKHHSDECISELLACVMNQVTSKLRLKRELVRQGRLGFAHYFEISDLVFHKKSIEWAANHEIKIGAKHFIHSTIDLYVFAQGLGILN